MFFIGVCRLLGRLLSVACGMYRYVFIGVCQLPGRVLSVACGMYRYACYRCVSIDCESAVGSLWNVSVCFLYVCVGCLGECCRQPVECIGMLFYRCVSVAWEIASKADSMASNHSILFGPIRYSSRFYPLILYSALLYSTILYLSLIHI